MSYEIELYRKEVKEKAEAYGDVSFWENEANITPFTTKQKDFLHNWLLEEGYVLVFEDEEGADYEHETDEDATAFLDKFGLCLATESDDAFEVNMLASKLALTGKFAKYNPENNKWDEDMDE